MVRSKNSIYIYDIEKQDPIIHLNYKDYYDQIVHILYFKEKDNTYFYLYYNSSGEKV